MADLPLPPGPADLLERTRAHLATHLGGEHHLCLGGGTALVVRWHHRKTTDLDFFIQAGPYARLYANRLAFQRDLEQATGTARRLDVRPASAFILLADGGEISVSTTPGFTENPRSDDTVRGTAIALETSEEILSRKIASRILDANTFVPRDLYDIAVAKHHEPDALAGALRRIRPDYLQQIAKELRYLPRDWMETHPRPVVGPADPGAARQAVFTVRAMLDQSRTMTWGR